MSVYVGELHSDVVPAVPAGFPPFGMPPGGPAEPELAERLDAAMCRERWLAARVAAEAFDD